MIRYNVFLHLDLETIMPEATNMTPQQLRELADRMEEEQKPIKTGRAKQAIYAWDGCNLELPDKFRRDQSYFFESEKSEIMHDLNKQVAESFCLIAAPGDLFYCYNFDGKELWANNEMEEGPEWARKNLIDIQEC